MVIVRHLYPVRRQAGGCWRGCCGGGGVGGGGGWGVTKGTPRESFLIPPHTHKQGLPGRTSIPHTHNRGRSFNQSVHCPKIIRSDQSLTHQKTRVRDGADAHGWH